MRLPILVVVAILGLCHAHAQDPVLCPWLTEGTAATVLGGTPLLQVKLGPPPEGSCAFTFQKEAVQSSLDIVVKTQPPSTSELSCPAGSPSLVGIGNSATICHLSPVSRGARLLLMSQVRGAYFSVVLTVPRGSVESPQEAITMIGEQVAGSLF